MLKKTAAVLLTILLLMVYTVPVYADDMCKITISLSVTDGFTENVTIYFQEAGDGEKHNFLLTEDKAYIGEFMVKANTQYTASYAFKNSAQYTIAGLSESYTTTKENFEIDLVLEKMTPTTPEGENSKIPEDMRDTARAVMDEYYEKVSVLAVSGNENHKTILDHFSMAVYKKFYLEDDDSHTEAEWDEMSETDQFNYYHIYRHPKQTLDIGNCSNLEQYISAYNTSRDYLINRDAEEVYNAIVKVREWHWTAWLAYKSFYNLLDENIFIPSSSSEESVVSESESTTGDSSLDSSANTWVKLSEKLFIPMLFIIAGLLVGVLLLIIYIKKRKK